MYYRDAEKRFTRTDGKSISSRQIDALFHAHPNETKIGLLLRCVPGGGNIGLKKDGRMFCFNIRNDVCAKTNKICPQINYAMVYWHMIN